MPAVKANDINLYYEIHGEGDWLVLIQGYGGSSGEWYRGIPLPAFHPEGSFVSTSSYRFSSEQLPSGRQVTVRTSIAGESAEPEESR